MALSTAFKSQIQNRNFLSPVGFKFTLNRAPKIAFFGNTANIPGLTLGVATQPTYLKDIDVPGDKIIFEDFTLRFLVDENLENYKEIQNWIRGLGYPESLKEIYDLQKEDEYVDTSRGKLMNIYSDGTLSVLNSNSNVNFNVKFRDMFPYSLTSLNFDATDPDTEYFTAEVSFKYTIYDILGRNENTYEC
tara:strand:+ start:63 stop:632 length:570 start_codon:yes stop_codon:yes gene_type:complete